MKNKEVLAQFIYINLPNQLKNCLALKNWKFINLALKNSPFAFLSLYVMAERCAGVEVVDLKVHGQRN